MTQAPLTVRRWTRAEYDRLVDRGAVEGEPLELIGGQLVVAEPQGSHHASAIGRVSDTIRARGAVQDYWIVSLVDRVLEMYHDPVPDSSAPYRWRYRSVERLTAPDRVALLGLPAVHIAVSDRLP